MSALRCRVSSGRGRGVTRGLAILHLPRVPRKAQLTDLGSRPPPSEPHPSFNACFGPRQHGPGFTRLARAAAAARFPSRPGRGRHTFALRLLVWLYSLNHVTSSAGGLLLGFTRSARTAARLYTPCSGRGQTSLTSRRPTARLYSPRGRAGRRAAARQGSTCLGRLHSSRLASLASPGPRSGFTLRLLAAQARAAARHHSPIRAMPSKASLASPWPRPHQASIALHAFTLLSIDHASFT